jgi:cytochrome c peroxidase
MVNTPTVFNSSLNHQQFWDGRASDLEEQITFVVENKQEFATHWPLIVAKLNQDTHYKKTFNKLYPDGITADNIRNAIAIYEQSLLTLNSPFDRYLLGDSNAINASAKEGYRLFKDYGCVACHQGSNVGGNLFMKFGVFGDYFAQRGNTTPADLGRFNVTGNESDRHVFRVPSLRLAVLTPPYFHDGSVETLDDAVKIMAKHQLGRIISEQDITYIVEFLTTLPGEYKGQPLGGTLKLQSQDKL